MNNLPNTTPNLGLHKYNTATDNNLTFNIDTAINDPYDIIDDQLGGQIVAKAAVAKTISQGVSIVNADRKSMFRSITFKGRTLVNLLGRDGNIEDIIRWLGFQSTLSADTTNKVYGNQSVKVTLAINGSGCATGPVLPKLIAGKYYILAADVKNGNATSAHLSIQGLSESNTPQVTDTTKFNIAWKKFSPGADATSYIECWTTGTTGQYAYFDGVRLYEISQAEYNALDSMTAAQVAAKYPYVDDMKHVNAVYAMNLGKNLLPPLSEWTSPTAMPTIIGAYKSVANRATEAPDHSHVILIPVISGQTYSFSADVTISYIGGTIGVGAYYNLTATKADGTIIAQLHSEPYATSNGTTTINKTFTIPLDAVTLRVVLGIATATGTFTFSNPMLNLGSTALPFEPQKPSYTFQPDVQARSSVEGSVADQFYLDGNGKPRIVRRFREIVLDGSLGWTGSLDYSGYKRVVAPIDPATKNVVDSTSRVVKYDGKILSNQYELGFTWGAADSHNIGAADGVVYITIADTDSGWGESYSPTADEVKAYFYGWRMFKNGQQSHIPYDGTGTKEWTRVDFVGGSSTLTTPTQPSGVEPYRLMYQLAQSIDEAVAHEGTLMFFDGPNQVEMGTGIVIREATTPKLYSVNGSYRINFDDSGSGTVTKLNNRALKILDVFRNGQNDDGIWGRSTTLAYGVEGAFTAASNFDQTKAYSVTYLALDTYKIGIAPQSISGTATPNIKEQVDDAVEAVTGLRRDVSVLQAQKAGKQQPQYITVSNLFNGWVARFASDQPRYYKDDTGVVHVTGGIKDGITTNGARIFTLPAGYRPATSRFKPCVSAGAFAYVEIGASGNVVVYNANTGDFIFDFSFRAEQ